MGAQPFALVARQLRERAREDRDLIRFETHQDLAFGRITGGREERRGREAQCLAEPREDSGARLFDAAGFELGDGTARDADLLGELALREMKTLAVRAHQSSKRRSGCDGACRHVRKLTA
jgi:hypothetical protein